MANRRKLSTNVINLRRAHVIRAILQGMSVREIALALEVSEATVRQDIQNLTDENMLMIRPEDRQAMLTMELHKLDELEGALLDAAMGVRRLVDAETGMVTEIPLPVGDQTKAVNSYIRLMEHRAKLVGLHQRNDEDDREEKHGDRIVVVVHKNEEKEDQKPLVIEAGND